MLNQVSTTEKVQLLGVPYRTGARNFHMRIGKMLDREKDERRIESKRIQFEFSSEAFARMEKLKEQTHARSYAELVRDALRAYEWMVGEKAAGNEIGALRGDRLINTVKLLF